MAIVTRPIRINTDDYPQEMQPTVERLADTINPSLESLYLALNGEVNFNNLSWGILTGFVVKVDSAGSLIVDGSDSRLTRRLQNPAKGTLVGSLVMRAVCLDDSNVFPSHTPFVSFSQNSDGSLTINNVRGLAPNLRHQISIIFFSN
jgi:hypothetical protein